MKITAPSVIACASALVLLGGTGSAAAAPAGHRPTHQPHAAHAATDRLAGLRAGARHALAADASDLTRISAASGVSTVLTADHRSVVAATVTADLAQLASDAQAVTTAASARSIQEQVRSARGTTQGARLQFQILSGADQIGRGLTDADAAAATITQQASALQAGGVDIAAVLSALDGESAQSSVARTQLATGIAAVLGVPTSPSAEQLRLAGKAGHQDLAAARAALSVAQQDLATAAAAVAALTATPAAT